jgi:alpha-beta hydrolase superfamily lysophospholipase
MPVRTGDRDGLLRHVVVADDGHPLRLYSRSPRLRPPPTGSRRLRSILLLHGRTWSSQPVWDVRASPDDIEGLSTLQALADLGYEAYALDFRGFGETPRDHRNYRGYATPNRCVDDVGAAMDWIADRHRRRRGGGEGDGDDDDDDDDDRCDTRPALLGWSQGALVAQLYAQRPGAASKMSDLILYGTIYDPSVVHPRRPLFDPISTAAASSSTTSSASSSSSAAAAPEVPNTEIASLEDFTIPGTVSCEAAYAFASLALHSDPIKAAWDELHEFDSCDPGKVSVPTLVVVGSRDPYVNWDAQARLFGGLGTEDRAMVVVPGCDHAVHLLKARGAFVNAVVGFLERNGDGP